MTPENVAVWAAAVVGWPAGAWWIEASARRAGRVGPVTAAVQLVRRLVGRPVAGQVPASTQAPVSAQARVELGARSVGTGVVPAQRSVGGGVR